MKKIILTINVLIVVSNILYAQNINWRAFDANQDKIIHFNTGLDYGLTFGLGFSKMINFKKPILLGIEYSFPSGENLIDDFMVRIGGQMEVIKVGSFSSTLKINGILRRFENSQARLVNWGGEFVGAFGYYKAQWFVAGEFGFDKAIITHVNHSKLANEQNYGLRSGWYIPAGGNFSYGLQTGLDLGKADFTLRLGKVIGQDFVTSPSFPFYTQIGLNRRF